MTDTLDDAALLRYARQILLPEIDIAGQQALAAGRVLIIGMGGLGCPAAQYLAAAGVGNLTVCDGDQVDLSNLQRQILYSEADLGRPKALAARDRLRAMNQQIRVSAWVESAQPESLAAALDTHDVVLDCTDNFGSRHAINRACRNAGKPLVSAAAIRWEGQLSVFDFRVSESACYACLYPDGVEDTEDTCSRSGVLGPLLGVLGSMQAAEAIRLLCTGHSPLAGQLLLVDAQSWQWRQIALRRDPTCGVCA
ncbi:MAG: HesA/MoeB/ThiF family protein [Acidithiobacillus ferrooxidans]|nr:HesA/MoeB/ThiF family protein [Acidithiobacillus ferrooxidans]MDD5003504.1 HesA/MoeB/ThiF family protein [Acidithiobacillus sp.]MDD5378365.1 HesA/MoeB/ThiF family protein [Acidithiobacillus sp.]MDD5576260.1 HesA/MoeB/ThiF family protein [Acidithiobacillus sp.]